MQYSYKQNVAKIKSAERRGNDTHTKLYFFKSRMDIKNLTQHKIINWFYWYIMPKQFFISLFLNEQTTLSLFYLVNKFYTNIQKQTIDFMIIFCLQTTYQQYFPFTWFSKTCSCSSFHISNSMAALYSSVSRGDGCCTGVGLPIRPWV